MEQRFFGPFDRPLIPVVESNPVTGKDSLVGTFNRPAGCTADNSTEFTCDPSVSVAWFTGSWVENPAWIGVYADCAMSMNNATMIAPLPTTSFGVGTFQRYPVAGLTYE